MKKIFFVGFDSSSSDDYVALRNHFGAVCHKFGCEAVFPIDGKRFREESRKYDTPLDEARAIFRSNLRRIDSASVVIANLNYFNSRGFCTNDAAFVIGYATSKDKQILGFVDADGLSEARCNTQDYMYYTPDTKKTLSRPVSHMAANALSVIIRGSIEDCLSVIFNDPYEEKTQETLGPSSVDDL